MVGGGRRRSAIVARKSSMPSPVSALIATAPSWSATSCLAESGARSALFTTMMSGISMIPALLSLMMFFFIREKKTPRAARPRERFWKNIGRLDSRLKLYLLVSFLFTLGNSSNTFLLLRAISAGFNDENVILLSFLYNLTASLLAIPFSRLSDCLGSQNLLFFGYLAFALVNLGFAFVSGTAGRIALLVLYGRYTAMTTGVDRALISESPPPELKGTMLGLHATLVGVALLPASLLFGLLWTSFGP